MCGIIGITGITNIVPMLVEGLLRLEYRGYDSAGFALIECGKNSISVLKGVGRIKKIVEAYSVARRCAKNGVGHTRWATHGPPTYENAHPHLDCSGRIAVVHNGIIKNYIELKRELIRKGHKFISDTDTEVIPHYIEELVSNGYSVLDALRELVKIIKGAYAFVLITTWEPDRLYFARNLSPLVIGVGDGFNIVSSDIPSFLKYTRNVIVINDGEIGYISPSEIYIERSGAPIDFARRVSYISWSIEDAEKGGYPHFMLKEINEQPRALNETLAGLQSDDSVFTAIEMLLNAEKIFVTGAGTSYHAALAFQSYMHKYTRRITTAFVSSEYSLYSILADSDSVLIAISQSGETIDTLQAVRAFKANGAKVIAISNVVGSTIPRESNLSIYMRAGPEIGVAATKTFLTQLLTLQYLVFSYMENNGMYEGGKYRDLLSKAPQVVNSSLAQSRRVIEKTAWKLKDAVNMFVLSREEGVAFAYEAALKIKEVSYIHAEAYPAGESKHGPIALIEKNFPVIFILPSLDKRLASLLQGNVMEMKARGAITVLVLPANARSLLETDYSDIVVDSGSVGHDILVPYAIMPPLQLLAYRLAVLRGHDPDRPRNLAKTVTVE